MSNFLGKIKTLILQGLQKPVDFIKSLIIGLLLSVFPIWGVSSVLITLIGLKLKLNIPLMLMVSYLAIPLQLYLLLPFIKLGENIFSVHHTLLHAQAIKTALQTDFFDAIQKLWLEVICGTTGWTLTVLPLLFVFHYLVPNKRSIL